MNSNKIWVTAAIALMTASAAAQNTFPASGNVGIGTASPASALDVYGNIATNSVYGFSNVQQGSSPYGVYISAPTSQALGFFTSSTQQVTINAAGNVGIGTTTPSQKLSVSGGSVDMDGWGYMSSYRSPDNGYTNLFLGGAIFDNGNGSYTVAGDGGSDYFAAIRMDNTGNNLGGINFYSGPSIGGSNYTLSNTQLASYMRMTINNGNVGIGTPSPGAKLEVDGSMKFTTGSGASITFSDNSVQSTAWNGTLTGADYAESVDVTGDRSKYDPGDVLVIVPGVVRTFQKMAVPYSKLVAGIYSTKPGVLGKRETTDAAHLKEEVPMAMVGIVPTKVSAENGPIQAGDLLVTSSLAGYAMKGTDQAKMLGAVIGKALGALDSGTGMIEVLVTLQ